MNQRQNRRLIQIIAYVMSAIVALSMVLGLLGQVLFKEPSLPTPTFPPTWTPFPTFTPAPTVESATSTPVAASTETPTPLPATATPSNSLVFAVTGESSGDEQVYRRLLEAAAGDGSTFLIHTGDLVDQATQASFEAFAQSMADFPLPFYPVPGNRDMEDGSLAQFLAYSGAPAVQYSLDAGPAHFTMVNSASGHLTEAHLAWIDQDLARTVQPVKIVVTHYPPFDPEGGAGALGTGSEAFLELMKARGVAYVFAGHIPGYHEVEREGTTYEITGGMGDVPGEGGQSAFHHYLRVTIQDGEVTTEVVRIE